MPCVTRDKRFSEIASTGCFRNFVEKKNARAGLTGWAEAAQFDAWGCSLVNSSGFERRFVESEVGWEEGGLDLGKVWLMDIYEV